ncbi:Uncharacterised protein [Helicobacter fennelliae]|uniref:Lipoprotein n=1 Tax=Helicobacter fennelliae TaxID=215 RepID=A0A2X3BJ00_9HELI|nr:hypothetical protein [Helicobacter fennelliae]SQB99286.1 Uncharacterised protein [Helicobacter fennelliae]STQ84896.1 Uncharacterised protein [Helicobacter fennelliae]
MKLKHSKLTLYAMITLIISSLFLGGCYKKPKAQGSFRATECKTICDSNQCQTKCLSADGTFK